MKFTPGPFSNQDKFFKFFFLVAMATRILHELEIAKQIWKRNSKIIPVKFGKILSSSFSIRICLKQIVDKAQNGYTL